MQPERRSLVWADRPRCDVGGLAAIVAGEGPLVLLLHGVGLRAESWNPVIDALSDSHRVVAPDLPGHGHSPHDTSLASLTDYTQAISGLFMDVATVAGHSMGAMIGMSLAECIPRQVRAVIALNAIFERDPTARKAVEERAAVLDGISPNDPQLTLSRWFRTTRSSAAEACHTWLTSVDPQGYRAAYSVFASENGPSRTSLKNLAMPALFLTGGNDPNSTPEMSHKMAALSQHGEAQVVQEAAHMLPMTHPQVVTSAIRRLAKIERT